MSKEIIHSLVLILAIALTFLFPKTSLADYDLQIAAGLFVFLYLAKKILPGKDHGRSLLLESVIFTLIIVGIVNTSGGASSPFFFLIYFLLFSLSLLLKPVVSITTTFTLIIFFLMTLPSNTNMKSLLSIFSLAFLTPFAMFMGQEYLEVQKSKVKSQKLQEDTFLFLSLMLKNHLKNIKNAVENFMGDHQLDIIRRSVHRMEKLIEKFEKNSPVFFTFTFLILTLASITNAVTLNSPEYRIESANVNDAAGNKSSEGYNLSDTIGQLAAGEFSSNGYVIKAGFQYLRIPTAFKFTLTNSKIDFGQLNPNSPVTGTTDLIVSLGGIRQYQVTAAEEGPLKALSGFSTIANTSCDGGMNTCTERVAKVWSANTTYGFGYNMSGQDIPEDFIDSSYYRRFADYTVAEAPAVIMASANAKKNRQSTMTLKVNISPVQTAGTYQTIINFVATPSY